MKMSANKSCSSKNTFILFGKRRTWLLVSFASGLKVQGRSILFLLEARVYNYNPSTIKQAAETKVPLLKAVISKHVPGNPSFPQKFMMVSLVSPIMAAKLPRFLTYY